MCYFFANSDVRCDLVKEVTTGCKLKKHVYCRDVGRLRAWLHYDSSKELENVLVLEGGMNAHLFVYGLALSLGGLWCQSHHLTSGDAMVLGIDSLKYRGEAATTNLLDQPIAINFWIAKV